MARCAAFTKGRLSLLPGYICDCQRGTRPWQQQQLKPSVFQFQHLFSRKRAMCILMWHNTSGCPSRTPTFTDEDTRCHQHRLVEVNLQCPALPFTDEKQKTEEVATQKPHSQSREALTGLNKLFTLFFEFMSTYQSPSAPVLRHEIMFLEAYLLSLNSYTNIIMHHSTNSNTFN